MEVSSKPVTPAIAGSRPAGSSLFRKQEKMAPYLFVGPFLILFALFGLWPIIQSLILSFYTTAGPKDHVFTGLANFNFVIRDPDFHTAVRNTVVFAFWSTFLQLPLALGLALLLSRSWLRARNAFRLAFFFPNLMGTVFVGVLFQILFLPQYGFINQAASKVTAGSIALDTKWLSDPAWVMPAIVLTSLWLYVGFNMIYFLAALQAVDKELYEAAQVDGANGIQQFWAVTMPGIKPVAVFVLVTSTIGSFQLFELPYILLQNTAGPSNSGLTIVMYLYNTGFLNGDLGYASAVGWTLAIGMLIISLMQIRLTGAAKGANE